MTLLPTAVPLGTGSKPSAGPGSSRVRIAISSPDILAQIRQVFASKNLAVEIVRMPYVEVAVRAVAAAPSPEGSSGGPAVALRPVGPAPRAGTPSARRLCAEYRLNVVEVGDWPRAERSDPAVQRHLVPVPDPDAGAEADGPAVALSQRQHQVMDLVSRGVRNAEIAALLQVREKTVKNHINRIFRAMGAGSRVEAVLIWQRHQRTAATRRDARKPPPAVEPAARPRPERAGTP